jgi:hypothetical protein
MTEYLFDPIIHKTEYLFNLMTNKVIKKTKQAKYEGYCPHCLLFVNNGVYTRFAGCDVRSKYDLTHIKKPLVFETAIKEGPKKGMKTFWATYHQARLGHRFFDLSDECDFAQSRMYEVRATVGIGYQLSSEHDKASKNVRDAVGALYGISKQLDPLLAQIGANNVDDLTRENGYVRIADREPVRIPATGYQSDIERFIRL